MHDAPLIICRNSGRMQVDGRICVGTGSIGLDLLLKSLLAQSLSHYQLTASVQEGKWPRLSKLEVPL